MMGITQKREDIDFDQTVICDVCEAYGHYNVYVIYTVLSLFFIPVWKWNRRYYVEMSCCHSLYELNEEVGREIERGTLSVIKESDLTLIRGNQSHVKKCMNCGYETAEDFEFCPKCGNRF
jgi:hypothetical protein